MQTLSNDVLVNLPDALGANSARELITLLQNMAMANSDNQFSAHQTFAAGMVDTIGDAALAANFTDALGVLLPTHLAFNLVAGKSYRIEGYLIVSNSLAADGSQFDFAGGTATATTFNAALQAVGSVVAGTIVSAALATVLNFTTNTGTDRIFINGYIKVNAGGTLILRAATNTTASGTMTLGAGSWLSVKEITNL